MPRSLMPDDDHSQTIENYKQLLETLNVIPWEYNWRTQKFMYVGPQACLFGYPIDDWYTDGFLQKLIHPDDYDDALQYCKNSVKAQQNYEYEYRIMRADGEICWVRKIVRILGYDDDGVILRGIYVDISAQKRAEEILLAQNDELRRRDAELRAKNEQFTTAINNMSQGLCMFDGDYRLIVCNTRYASMYQLPPELTRPGTPADDIVNFRIEKGIFPAVAHREYIQNLIAEINERGPQTVIQEQKDGGFVETSRISMASGGWLSTHEDITERRRADKALQESRELLLIAFRASPVAMVISTPEDGRFIEVNEAWSTMLGYSREEALVTSALNIGVWVDSKARNRFVQLINDKGAAREFEARYRTKDGRELDVLLSGESAEINGRQRLLVVSHDITDRKKTELELIAHRDHLQEMVEVATRELKEKAEELRYALDKERDLNELQRQFVSMASHEFRTPLAIIDGTAQRLIKMTERNKLSSGDAMERYDKIRASVQRMTTLMESTLGASQMEEGKIKVRIGACQIRKVLKDVCLRQQEITKKHMISCHMTNLPEVIQADTGAIEQVLTNLLSNAEKYAPNAFDIEVNAYAKGDEVVISVRDQGIGIDEDELDKIGERFFRARTSTGIPGTGIGINLSRKLLEMHGGSIRVESKKALGSTFFIILPIAGPEH